MSKEEKDSRSSKEISAEIAKTEAETRKILAEALKAEADADKAVIEAEAAKRTRAREEIRERL